nr:PREDICTED: amyotrophic lateral sclerosis 2 chromosomal region candidate gene 11 protein [Lepisosteus oculatus]
MPKLLGKMTLNLLDIVHKMTFTELHDLKLKGQVICKIELEISFTYGSLGYGYSHQLRHPQKDLQTIAERSQFLRIFPLEQRKDPHFNVTTGRPSEYPEFLSPHLNVQVGSPAKSEHNILSSSPVEDLSTPKMSQMVLEIMQTRKRLNELKKVYENFQTRGESIQFIEKLVMKKGPRQNNPPRMYKKFKVNKWKKAAALIPILVAAVTPEVKSRDVAVPLMKHVSFQEDPEQGLREHTTVDVAGLLKHQVPEEDSKANNVLEKTDTEELQLAGTATCSTGTKLKKEELQPKKETEDSLQSLDKKLSSLSLSTSPAPTNQTDSQTSRLSRPDSQRVDHDGGQSAEDRKEEKESVLRTNVPVVPGGIISVSVSLTKSSSMSVISKNMPAQDQDKNVQHSVVDSCVLTTWRSSREDNREGVDSDQISSFKTVPWLLSSGTRETFSQPPCESTDVRLSEELKTITEDLRKDGELQLEDEHHHSGTITSKASDIAPVGHTQSRAFILNQEQISGQALSSPDPEVDPTVLKLAQEISRAQPSTPRYPATVNVTDTGLESPKLGQKLEADITMPSFSDYFAPAGSGGTSSGPSQGGKPSKPGKEKPKMTARSHSPYDRLSKTAKKSCQTKK